MIKPYPFQLQGAIKIENFGGRALLADDVGLGKTAQILLYSYWNSHISPIIVVCPAGAKYTWEEQAKIHFGWLSSVLETRKASNRVAILPRRLVIVNFDILHNWLKVLLRMKPKLIIIDEAHAIGNMRTIRTRTLQRLCKGVPHVVCLTATPITKRPIEFFPMLNILRPDLFPSYWKFGHAYCGARRKPWGVEFKGASNLKQLHAILHKNLMIRRHKEDVLEQLPPKTRSVIPLKITNISEYNEAVNNFISWLYKRSPERVKGAEKAEALVKVGYLLRLVAELKLPSVMRWVDDFLSETDEKLILFGVHKSVIKQLVWKYKSICVKVDGSVTGRKRQLAIEKFVYDKHTRLLIGNMKAGGAYWSAKGINHLAFFELAWTPGLHTQAEGRAHGIGRGKVGVGTSIYYLIGKDTCEIKMCKDLQSAQTILDKTLDGKITGRGIDLFDKLIDSLYSSRRK